MGHLLCIEGSMFEVPVKYDVLKVPVLSFFAISSLLTINLSKNNLKRKNCLASLSIYTCVGILRAAGSNLIRYKFLVGVWDRMCDPFSFC